MRVENLLNRLAAIPKPLGWALLTGLFTGIALLTTFFPLYLGIPINIVLPISVLLLCKMVFFERLKLSTLIVMRLVIIATVLSFISPELCLMLALIFLAINILEATLTDLIKAKNYFNFISGLALIIAIPLIILKNTHSQAYWTGKYYTFNFEGVWFWIIAYTIWNWNFVTREFSASIGKMHMGVLLAPILGSLVCLNPGLWLILRGNSLVVAGTIQIADKGRLEDYFKDDKFAAFVGKYQSSKVQFFLMVLNVILALLPVYL